MYKLYYMINNNLKIFIVLPTASLYGDWQFNYSSMSIAVIAIFLHKNCKL